ncbi:MAG: transcription termination factor Rho [Clostridia bacterium]|nr:transcription termination factor Rho [Clostridia bacterium]
MAATDWSSMTVAELKKIAKENGIHLPSNAVKAKIIELLADAMGSPAPADEAPEAPANDTPDAVQEEETQSAEPRQPVYKSAWSAPAQQPQGAPRYSAKPSYQAPVYQNRPAWQGGSDRGPQRQPARTPAYTPRFGPAAAEPQQQEYRGFRDRDTSRAFGPTGGRSNYGEQNRGYNNRNYEQSGYNRPSYPKREQPGATPESIPISQAASDILSASECSEGSGYLELHPDGYGFLRPENFLQSPHDIYISVAQIRRFGLRTGDFVCGKTRPQRDGDKYAAMLYITQVNGKTPEEQMKRPLFDDLTPVYPSRRIDLDSHDERKLDDMRIIDLLTPIGFGQRGLILCPPGSGKTELLQHFAQVLTANYPEAEVMVLLIDENPEDVTLFRDQVNCSVMASTFDQLPESHLRITEMVLERAQRLVEQGKDVILLVDSLTRLAKVFTTTAAQQGRSIPGLVNPTSLFRAKKLFGAARCMKEGGSLTVIGAMNIETGSKVDDTIVEEFKGTANLELVLDKGLHDIGISPALRLGSCGTRRVELLLTPEELQGLRAVRSIIGSMKPEEAIPQLLDLLHTTDSNTTFLGRVTEWAVMLRKNR